MRRITAVPSVTRARQVPQTPPLQANGRSGRTRWAPSRIAVPAGRVRVVLRPSRMMVTLAPATGRGVFVGGLDRGLVADPEQLAVDPAGFHAELAEHLGRARDQAEGAAQPPVVGAGDVDRGGQQRGQPVGVEAAAEQLDLLGLARQDVH